MASLKLDREFQAWVANVKPPPLAIDVDVLGLREHNNKVFREISKRLGCPPGVERARHTITSKDGTEIEVSRFTTEAHRAAAADSASALPAVVWAFGGGLITGAVDIYEGVMAWNVAETGVQLFAVDYRVAPEHPAPAAVEDVYAAVAWLSAHAAGLGVDPARIAVGGESAGGGVAAGAALLARDRGLVPPLAKQILIYPMLDDRTSTRVKPDDPLVPFLSWSVRHNELGWGAYLGADRAGRPEADVSPYEAPARATDLAGLPSTYIDVGGLDLFRDESVAFAARLAAANIDVEFHLYSGVPHGFDIVPESEVVKIAKQARIKAYRSF